METWRKHISIQEKLKTMFETINVILTNIKRNLWKKMRETPVLYIFFITLIIFSILIFAFLTFYIQVVETRLEIKLEDIFFLVFFIFMAKSAFDFYNYYIKPNEVSYALSTQINQKRTISEIFLSVLLTNLSIWFMFSTLYLFFLLLFGINIGYPFEYLIFNLGVLTAICLGTTICINFYSTHRIRLLPTIILFLFYLYSREPLFIALTLPIAFLQLVWSINHAMSSYQNIRRKQRLKEKSQIKARNPIKAIFNKETTLLWRDKLFFSFIFTSAGTGLGAGYLYLYGDEIFIPETLRQIYGNFLPSLFVFMGVLVVVLYTAVFPALNLFLNEEKTMWIIKHIPCKSETLLYGKLTTLTLCFITGLPFIAYIVIFTGLEILGFIIWFLVFSYIAGVIVSVPLGVKYVGRKSDILLLYSVAMILLGVLGFAVVIATLIWNKFENPYLFFMLFLLVESLVLYLSLKISVKMLDDKYLV